MSLGFGEMAVIMAAGALAIGPRGMPKFARQAGHALGTTVRVLKEGRSALNTFSKENELAELREELQEGLYEVNRIRGEWKDLSQPTSFANALFDNDNSAARSSPAPATTGNGVDAAGIQQQQGGGAAAVSGAAQQQQQQQQQWQEGAAPQQAAPRASLAYTDAASRSPPPPAMPYGAGASFVAGSVVSRRAAAALHASPEEPPSTAPRASATNNSTAAKST